MAFLLVVDDDEEFADAVALVCRSEGHEVVVESRADGVEARIGARPPDLVILDVMFPEDPSAGFKIARTIHKKLPDLPILMLTGVNQKFPLGFSNKDIESTWLPVSTFLEKPIDFDMLKQKVRLLLSGPSTPD